MTFRLSRFVGYLFAFAVFVTCSGLAVELSEDRAAQAHQLLVQNGIDPAQFQVVRFLPSRGSGFLLSVRQLHLDLPVFDKEYSIHFAEDGSVIRGPDREILLTDAYGSSKLQDLSGVMFDPEERNLVSSSRAVVALGAEATWREHSATPPSCAENEDKTITELGIYQATIVWRAACKYGGPQAVFVNAETGGLVGVQSGF